MLALDPDRTSRYDDSLRKFSPPSRQLPIRVARQPGTSKTLAGRSWPGIQSASASGCPAVTALPTSTRHRPPSARQAHMPPGRRTLLRASTGTAFDRSSCRGRRPRLQLPGQDKDRTGNTLKSEYACDEPAVDGVLLLANSQGKHRAAGAGVKVTTTALLKGEQNERIH